MSSFISQTLTKIEAVTGRTFACICHTVFPMFSCLQINWQPFYLLQVLKFHPFDWLIEIYFQKYSPQNEITPTNAWFNFSPLLGNALFLHCLNCDSLTVVVAVAHFDPHIFVHSLHL